MNLAKVGVAAVVLHDGRILLVRRAHAPALSKWSVPGGHVAFGEDLHTAVLRELREETGLDGVVDRFLGWVERMGSDPDPYHYVILDFVVDVLEPETAVAGDDAAELGWFDLEAVAELDLVDGLYDFLVDTGIVTDTRRFSL